MFLSRLKIQHGHCSGLGGCHGSSSIPAPGTFECRRCGQKKKKKKKEGKLHAYVEVLYIIKISSSSKVIGPLQRLIHQEVIL